MMEWIVSAVFGGLFVAAVGTCAWMSAQRSSLAQRLAEAERRQAESVEELRAAHAQRQQDMEQRAKAVEEARGLRELLQRTLAERGDAAVKVDQLNGQITELKSSMQHLQTRLADEQRLHEEKLKTYRDAEEQLKAQFKALSADALQASREEFLKQAKMTIEGVQQCASKDFEARQKAIDEMVKPVRETLAKYETKLEGIEKERAAAHAALREQLEHVRLSGESLRMETGRLVKALGKPGVRGRWGELTLRRVVELAGMSEHCDFSEQVTADGGRLRPDLVVHLPGECEIVVDAKTPLDGFLAALDATSDEERALHLARHVEHVRTKVGELSQKKYWEQFDRTPEFVVMFVPGETFLEEALRQDGTLLERAAAEGVVIATPMTLISLLKAVAYGWQQQRLAENAQAVIEVGRDMHGRLATLAEHLAKVGTGLERAVESYNQFVGSFERNAVSQARRFEELSVKSGKVIKEPEQVEIRVREVRGVEGTAERMLLEGGQA